MTVKRDSTQFATSDRASRDTIQRQKQIANNTTLLRQLYDAVTEIVIILNAQRQIVFYNRALVECLGLSEPDALYGLRPGEALNCRHAFKSPGGCGATEFCRTCGAVNAIISSQSQKANIKECSILQRDGGQALDFLVRATPLTLDGEPYTVFAVTDISHEKRRRALERIFFHDLMNTAAGLEMFARLLTKATPERMDDIQDQIDQGVRILLEQIRSQRDLAAAENKELTVGRTEIASRTLLQGLVEFWRLHESATLQLAPDSPDIRFVSDATLLSRVLNNMIKNAVEASASDEPVRIGCIKMNAHVEFWVHNTSFMPPDVQARIFQRSFSTKGMGRGLGTYSMKLLGEQYLKAQVSFTSTQDQGTRFHIRCPLSARNTPDSRPR